MNITNFNIGHFHIQPIDFTKQREIKCRNSITRRLKTIINPNFTYPICSSEGEQYFSVTTNSIDTKNIYVIGKNSICINKKNPSHTIAELFNFAQQITNYTERNSELIFGSGNKKYDIIPIINRSRSGEESILLHLSNPTDDDANMLTLCTSGNRSVREVGVNTIAELQNCIRGSRYVRFAFRLKLVFNEETQKAGYKLICHRISI
jgi:hypothetical protein